MSGDDSHTASLCIRISVTQISDPGLMKRNPEKMIQALLMHNNIIQKAKIKVRVGSNDSRVHATGCFRHAGEAGKSNGQVGCIYFPCKTSLPLALDDLPCVQNFGYTAEQEGDSFSLVFEEPGDAVKFCLQVG